MTTQVLKYANDVSINRSSITRKSVSVGGYYRSEKGGPTLYSMNVNLKPLTLEEYKEVEVSLINIQDGIDSFMTTIPNAIQLTYDSPAEGTITVAATPANNMVTIKGVDTPPAAGDFVQFGTDTKVYQINGVPQLVSVDDKSYDITLNNSTIITPTGSVRFGNDVEFQMVISNRPSVTIIPGPGFNYYQYDQFEFREVLRG